MAWRRGPRLGYRRTPIMAHQMNNLIKLINHSINISSDRLYRVITILWNRRTLVTSKRDIETGFSKLGVGAGMIQRCRGIHADK